MARITEFAQLPTAPGWGAYDWQQMLGYTSETQGDIVRLGQLYKIEAMWSSADQTGSDSGANYTALMELWDGSWATLHAGCDDTGWGGTGDYIVWRLFGSRNEAVRDGLNSESRRWLNINLPESDEAKGAK